MSSREDSLAIPQAIRLEVLDRDGGLCRLCGRTNVIAHHIRYGGDAVGMGGRGFHAVENIVSLGQWYEHRCHDVVHGAKALWQPVLLAVIERPGVTGHQLYRWAARGAHSDETGLAPDAVERIIQDQARRRLGRARRV